MHKMHDWKETNLKPKKLLQTNLKPKKLLHPLSKKLFCRLKCSSTSARRTGDDDDGEDGEGGAAAPPRGGGLERPRRRGEAAGGGREGRLAGGRDRDGDADTRRSQIRAQPAFALLQLI